MMRMRDTRECTYKHIAAALVSTERRKDEYEKRYKYFMFYIVAVEAHPARYSTTAHYVHTYIYAHIIGAYDDDNDYDGGVGGKNGADGNA